MEAQSVIFIPHRDKMMLLFLIYISQVIFNSIGDIFMVVLSD